MESDGEEEAKDDDALDVSEIDAFWLQRTLARCISDAEEVFSFEKKVLQMLGKEDLRECENRLVEHLGFEHFAVIRKLLKNRHKVYFCTLLGQAQNAEEKENVLREMKRSIDGIRVLELLQSETGRARRKAQGRTDTNVQ